VTKTKQISPYEEIDLFDELQETFDELTSQLGVDEEKHGDKWKEMPLKGQEERIIARLKAYVQAYRQGEIETLPWLKIMALCHIARTRIRNA
jgi:hypothetical protein